MMRGIDGLLVALLLLGCGHVTLVVPPRDETYASRVAAYQQLRPVARDVEKLVTRTNQKLYQSTRSVTLGGGATIRHPVDLLPAVLPDSLTGKRILDYQARNAPWNLWGGIAAGSMVTGLSLLFGSLLPMPRSASDAPLGMVLSGIGLAVVGTLSAVIIGAVLVGDTASARELCFASYEADLIEYLNIGPGDAEHTGPGPGSE